MDDDLADALVERARLLELPFKQVVNDAIRRGLSQDVEITNLPRFQLTPNNSGFVSGVDPLRLNQLNDQMQAEERGAVGAVFWGSYVSSSPLDCVIRLGFLGDSG